MVHDTQTVAVCNANIAGLLHSHDKVVTGVLPALKKVVVVSDGELHKMFFNLIIA